VIKTKFSLHYLRTSKGAVVENISNPPLKECDVDVPPNSHNRHMKKYEVFSLKKYFRT